MAALGLFVLLAGPHRFRVLLCLLLAVAGLYLFAPATYWDEVRSIETAGETGDTGEARMYLWGMAWRMFLDHPIFGVGTRNYGIQAPYYEDVVRADLGGFHSWGKVAHSLYFTLLAEQGIAGALMFVAVIVWCARAVAKLRRRGRSNPDHASCRSAALQATGLSAGIFAFLITGAFLTVVYYPLFWVLTALLASLDATAPTCA
jgi:O-antigen ligase